MTYKPRFEKLADRIVAAVDAGQFCSAVTAPIDMFDSTTNVAPTLTSLTTLSDSQVGVTGQVDAVPPYIVDPDENGVLDENDVLQILFVIRDDGMGPYKPLYVFPPDREFVSGADLAQSMHAKRWDDCDVNQDSILSPLDVLLVINKINQSKL